MGAAASERKNQLAKSVKTVRCWLAHTLTKVTDDPEEEEGANRLERALALLGMFGRELPVPLDRLPHDQSERLEERRN